MNDATDGQERYTHLDGLRGVAAFIVLIYHLIYFFFTPFIDSDPTDFWVRIVASSPLAGIYNGRFSVWIFFVLSGFVLSIGVSRSGQSLLALLPKRYVRLTLPILATSLIAFLLIRLDLTWNLAVADVAPGMGQYYPADFRPSLWDVISDSLFRTYLTGQSAFNGVLWSMKVEIVGSLLVFLVWKICPTRLWRVVVCLCLTVGLCFLKKSSTLQGLQLFPCGILLFDLVAVRDRRSRWLNWSPITGFFVLLLGVSLGGWLVKDPALPGAHLIFTWLLNPIMDIKRFEAQQIGAVLVVAALCLTPAFRQPLSGPLVRWLGQISFPLYLIHGIVIASVGCLVLAHMMPKFGYVVAASAATAVSVACSLIVAALLVPLVEQSAIRLSHRLALWIESLAERRRAFR
jgi:peptidoglycan/LPS O-acetylase OafA/YrhL